MRKYYTLVLFCVVVHLGQSQVLQIPQPSFSYACVSDSFNSFQAKLGFTEKPFPSDNVFHLELSDASGDFSQPHTVATLTQSNTAFEFTATFSLPQTVSGKGYRLRVRSTSPAMVSSASAPFEAYFVPADELVLNAYSDLSICVGSSAVIELDKDVSDSYIWYKNNSYYKTTTTPYLDLTEGGTYFAEPDLGACTGSLFSNVVEVVMGETFEVSLLNETAIESCNGQTVVLEASVNDPLYSYVWYKDGDVLPTDPENPHLYTLQTKTETSGMYWLEVTNEAGCVAVTQKVSLSQAKTEGIRAKSSLHTVILGESAVSLEIEVSDPTAITGWYKDGVIMAGTEGKTTIEVAEAGDYQAEATISSVCETSTRSDVFHVYEPVSFELTIDYLSNYASCENSQTQLGLSLITATLDNGDALEISRDVYSLFSFRWLKDSEVIGGGDISLSVGNYQKNGWYELELEYQGATWISNGLDVQLGLTVPVVQQERPLSCTQQALISATPMSDVIYHWYKDGSLLESTVDHFREVSEPGDYQVSVEFAGCMASSAPITIENEAPVVQVYPGTYVSLPQQGPLALRAEGGESYQWFDASGTLLGEGGTLYVETEGFYTVKANRGGCVVEETIEVYADLAALIPNVVTPNGDSLNDTWTLPARLISDPDVEVVILDSYGSKVLETTNYDNSWPQNQTASAESQSVYYYILNKKGENIQKGSITLVR